MSINKEMNHFIPAFCLVLSFYSQQFYHAKDIYNIPLNMFLIAGIKSISLLYQDSCELATSCSRPSDRCFRIGCCGRLQRTRPTNRAVQLRACRLRDGRMPLAGVCCSPATDSLPTPWWEHDRLCHHRRSPGQEPSAHLAIESGHADLI
jgi:hypothetical protein